MAEPAASPLNQKAVLQETIRRERKAVLVVNTRSRKGEATYNRSKRLLIDAGVDLVGTYAIRSPERLPEVIRNEIARGHKFIIVGGGDGTVSAVADHFAYQDVVFGLLPLGTANSFARTLSIPVDLQGAVDVLLSGKVVDVDLAVMNGDYFANSATIGLAAGIARSVPHSLKKFFGRVGYLMTAAALLRSYEPFECTLTLADGRQLHFPSVLELRIANGPYKGGMLVAPSASVESRQLVVELVEGNSRWKLVKVWARLAAGVRPDAQALKSFTAGEFDITTIPSQYVSVDGEAVAQTPVNVKVAKQALKVLAPLHRDDLS